jgi:hypothetical protein
LVAITTTTSIGTGKAVFLQLVHGQISRPRQKMPRWKSIQAQEFGSHKNRLVMGFAQAVAVRTRCAALHQARWYAAQRPAFLISAVYPRVDPGPWSINANGAGRRGSLLDRKRLADDESVFGAVKAIWSSGAGDVTTFSGQRGMAASEGREDEDQVYNFAKTHSERPQLTPSRLMRTK